MDSQAENCAKCGCLPDDILTLTCNHDICLPCASRNLHREIMKYGDNTKSIICELCGASTVLDDSSVEELLKVPSGETGVRERSSWAYSPTNQLSGYGSPAGENRANSRTPQGQRNDVSRFGNNEHHVLPERVSQYSERRTMRAFCIEHPDEEISYFCFDCLTNCICPECIIHGAHKNHEVLTVKRAYTIIKTKVEDALNGLSSKLDEEKLVEEKFNHSKREMRDNNKLLKKQVNDIFQEIRNRIEKKEKEILNTMDTALEEAIREVDTFLKTLENKAAAVSGTFDLVKNHLTARDEVLLLNFYANNHLKLRQQIDSEDINFKKVQESYIPKVPMNFNEIIDSLNILQVQISAIGNVGSEKFKSYPAATSDYLGSVNGNGSTYGKENTSGLKRDIGVSRKDYYPGNLSSYSNNVSQAVAGSGQKGSVQENVDRSAKTNFRNFQYPAQKTSNESRPNQSGFYDRFK